MSEENKKKLNTNKKDKASIEDIEQYLQTIEEEKHRICLQQIFDWMKEMFPSLEAKILWKQPMFVEHGTFIIGFSASQKHFSISPEAKGIEQFSKEIEKAGYTQSKNLFRIGWDAPINFCLLEKIIKFNRMDKKDYIDFWRK